MKSSTRMEMMTRFRTF